MPRLQLLVSYRCSALVLNTRDRLDVTTQLLTGFASGIYPRVQTAVYSRRRSSRGRKGPGQEYVNPGSPRQRGVLA